MTDKIRYDSDEAAKHVDGISGWVSSTGRFWGKDEHMARWEGCTHKDCEDCGKEMSKGRIRCDECVELARKNRYAALLVKDWDYKTPLYSDSHERFLFDEDELSDFLHETEDSISDLDLVICRPVKMRMLDEDHFLEDLHEDAECPEDLSDAIDRVNEIIANMEPVCWEPDRFAARVNQD